MVTMAILLRSVKHRGGMPFLTMRLHGLVYGLLLSLLLWSLLFVIVFSLLGCAIRFQSEPLGAGNRDWAEAFPPRLERPRLETLDNAQLLLDWNVMNCVMANRCGERVLYPSYSVRRN